MNQRIRKKRNKRKIDKLCDILKNAASEYEFDFSDSTKSEYEIKERFVEFANEVFKDKGIKFGVCEASDCVFLYLHSGETGGI